MTVDFDPDIQEAMERIQQLRREGGLLGIFQITIHFNPDNGAIKKMHVNRIEPVSGEALVDLVESAMRRSVESMKAAAAAYVCFTWRTYSEFGASVRSVGLEPAACIVWDKGSIGLGNQHYRPQHEFIFFCHELIFYMKGKRWRGGKAESDVWKMARAVLTEYVHPTQKPVELIERALNNSSIAGDLVLDVFGGSGSTLIACERTSRSAYLMELDPKYVDVIVQRWQGFTGKEVLLESTKKTFNQTASSRRPR